jgi:hypothetical protein
LACRRGARRTNDCDRTPAADDHVESSREDHDHRLLERADQLAAPGAIGTTTDSMHFVLINIPNGPVGTSGAKPGGAPSMDKGYRLDGDLETLNPHVGHKVEIAGFVEEPAATNGTATSVNGPMVKVQSIKMLAETCGR